MPPPGGHQLTLDLEPRRPSGHVSDAQFVASLKASQRAVERVAEWLTAGGLDVSVPPVRIRPSFERRFEYADHGDLVLRRLVDGRQVEQVIEVKHRHGVPFTSSSDYKWPLVLVDQVRLVERHPPGTLLGHVIVSGPLTHACFVPVGELANACKRPVFHHLIGRSVESYLLPRAFGRWVRMTRRSASVILSAPVA